MGLAGAVRQGKNGGMDGFPISGLVAEFRVCWHAREPAFPAMPTILFSCQNATCAVPETYRSLFEGAEGALASTDGWEPGALNLAQAFAMRFGTPLVHGDVTRLLIDLSKDDDARWSRFSSVLPEAVREKIADRHARPYRTQLAQRIAEDLRRHAMVVHVMVHTSPDIHGRVLLETLAGAALAEAAAASWVERLRKADLDASHLRGVQASALEEFVSEGGPVERYGQLRLTVAQGYFLEGVPWRWQTVKGVLLDSLERMLAELRPLSVPGSPVIAPD